MKPIRLITALLSVLLTGNVMAHGGEDHGDEPAPAVAAVATDPAGRVAHETSTETVELLLKHPLLEKKKPGKWRLFLADPMTNRPIGNARVEVTFSQIVDLKPTFTVVSGHPGIYQADITLPQEGTIDAIVSVRSDSVNDLLIVGKSASVMPTLDHVVLAKESQFLLGVETAVAKRETVKNAVQAFGKITHRATGEQDILAPTAGRLRLPASGKIPIAGQSVQKGDILGEIETIGTLSLRAPFDGVIAFSEFHPGQWVEAGTVLFKVTDPSVVWVESRLFEKDIALLAPGATATLTVESLPNQGFAGTILAIGKTFDETSRSLPVTIEVQNPQDLLKVGQWAKVFLETATSAEAIAVPKSAILMKEGVPVVFVKRSAEVFEGRPVELMNEYGDVVYLSAGIADGEKVVVNGNYQLLPFLKTLVPQALVPGGGR